MSKYKGVSLSSFFNSDFALITFYFFLGMLCVNIYPTIKIPYFLFLFLMFYRSNRDYLYFLLLFILMQGPGGFFSKYDRFIINLSDTVGVPFEYFFILIALIKFRNKLFKRKYYFVALKFILFYYILLIPVSIIFGLSLGSTFTFILSSISLILFLLLPVVFNNKIILEKSIKIIFFTTILLFSLQIFDLIFPYTLYSLSDTFDYMLLDKSEFSRVSWVRWFSFLSITCSLFFLSLREISFSRGFLSTIVIIALLSTFLTATRGYILQFLFLIFVYFTIQKNKSFGLLILGIIFLAISYNFISPVKRQIDYAAERMLTLESVIKGDMTAEGTLIRITQRAPRVWNKYIESPIFGFGFSETGFSYNDGHVGNYTLLLQGGLVGVIIFIFFIISIIRILFQDYYRNKDKLGNLIIIGSIISLIIAHSTSSIFFTYFFEPALMFVMGFILIFIQIYVFNINQK